MALVYYYSFFLVIFVLVLVVFFVYFFFINELLFALFMCFVVQIRLVYFLNCYYKLLLLCLKCLFLFALLGFCLFICLFLIFFVIFFLCYYFCAIFSCLLGSCFCYLSGFSILFFIFLCNFCIGLACVVCVLVFY